ncbi:metalloregulator ArsR/SmtB family transcription factor [Pseudoalteromonas fenneropenaei]|uniref:Metalloregulator ArsR/SmtB family transcription factor n=1 Tax=Pseudoalteromonas fenneropenaei TaxID=1737459 RepID=A0ABV7CHK6_9GAMM
MLTPVQFYKCLSDELRLKSLLLILSEGELCVCELMAALNEPSQPKVSRHLAQLRSHGLLQDRKQQQWVFYSLAETLPLWMQQALQAQLTSDPNYIATEQQLLHTMGDRPVRQQRCC